MAETVAQVLKKLLRGVLIVALLIWGIPIACSYLAQQSMKQGKSSSCGMCDPHETLVAPNGEQLSFSQGTMTGRTGEILGLQDCNGAMVISYQNNPEYAQTQIQKMGKDYWKQLPNCSSNNVELVSQLREVVNDYATQLSFPLSKPCYFHQEYTEKSEDINVWYDPDENKLFLLYLSY